MSDVSPRLQARVERDFNGASAVHEVLAILRDIPEDERVQAAIVLWGNGRFDKIQDAARLAKQDWRDVLVRAGLENADWPARLDLELGETAPM